MQHKQPTCGMAASCWLRSIPLSLQHHQTATGTPLAAPCRQVPHGDLYTQPCAARLPPVGPLEASPFFSGTPPLCYLEASPHLAGSQSTRRTSTYGSGAISCPGFPSPDAPMSFTVSSPFCMSDTLVAITRGLGGSKGMKAARPSR